MIPGRWHIDLYMLTRQHLYRYMNARARAYVGARAVSWKFVETVKTKITLQRRLRRGILISSNGAAIDVIQLKSSLCFLTTLLKSS